MTLAEVMAGGVMKLTAIALFASVALAHADPTIDLFLNKGVSPEVIKNVLARCNQIYQRDCISRDEWRQAIEIEHKVADCRIALAKDLDVYDAEQRAKGREPTWEPFHRRTVARLSDDFVCLHDFYEQEKTFDK
jgi:hypothetical protein